MVSISKHINDTSTNEMVRNRNAIITSINSFSPVNIQPKLTIGSQNDSYEMEADTMADKVMRMPENNFVQRKCASCENEEENIQRKSITPFIQTKSANQNQRSDTISSQINSSRGSGSSLDNQTKSFMESRFGNDFSSVNIHTGSDAVQMNRELNAQAFTTGNDIYFNEGKYQPQTDSGKHLLAHELTHVVQQKPQIQKLAMPATIPGCNTEQQKKLETAGAIAESLLKTAVSKLGSFISTNSDEDLKSKLIFNFRSSDKDTAGIVSDVLNKALSYLNNVPEKGLSCEGKKGRVHASTIIDSGEIMFYERGIDQAIDVLAATFLHEVFHSVTNGKIADKSYTQLRIFDLLSKDDALTSAAHYESFVSMINSEKLPAAQPSDSALHCKSESKNKVAMALAKAEFANLLVNDAALNLKDDIKYSRGKMLELIFLDNEGHTDASIVEEVFKISASAERVFKKSISFVCTDKEIPDDLFKPVYTTAEVLFYDDTILISTLAIAKDESDLAINLYLQILLNRTGISDYAQANKIAAVSVVELYSRD